MMNRPRRHLKSRKGVAVTEAAFCVPIILILVFGTLEVCNLIFIKERVSICAFEGCRVGVKRYATREDVEEVATELMTAFGFEQGSYDIRVSPDNFNTLNALDPISVTVEVPLSGTASILGGAINQTNISSTVRMVREFDD